MAMTRKEAREAVFGLIFETEFRSEETAEDIYESSVENREIGDNEYIKSAFFTVCEKRDEIDALIGEHADGWKTNRLTNVSRSILRLAVYEMLYDESIPYSVTSRCPHCKSENILDKDDMIVCDGCGELLDPEDMFYIDDSDEWYCTDCYSEMFDIPDNI